MNIVITQTPLAEECAQYEALIERLFPTKALYISLAASTLVLAVMAFRYIRSPGSLSVVYPILALVCLVLSGCVLIATKKDLPSTRERLLSSLEKEATYTFTDDEIAIDGVAAEHITYPRKRLAGQYYTDSHYVFCVADGMRMVPYIIMLTAENLPDIKTFVAGNAKLGYKIKRFKIK